MEKQRKEHHCTKNLPVRPTTDFAKESLFNILNNRIDFEDCKLLELFMELVILDTNLLPEDAIKSPL